MRTCARPPTSTPVCGRVSCPWPSRATRTERSVPGTSTRATAGAAAPSSARRPTIRRCAWAPRVARTPRRGSGSGSTRRRRTTLTSPSRPPTWAKWWAACSSACWVVLLLVTDEDGAGGNCHPPLPFIHSTRPGLARAARRRLPEPSEALVAALPDRRHRLRGQAASLTAGTDAWPEHARRRARGGSRRDTRPARP
jgi:hypothetical protein